MHLLPYQQKSLPFSALQMGPRVAENIETGEWQAVAEMPFWPLECIQLVEVLKKSYQTQC